VVQRSHQCGSGAKKSRNNTASQPQHSHRCSNFRSLLSAQNVVGSVKQLVENANEVAQGEGGEEHLIAASKMVAAATAQLVSASRAKAADPFSNTQQQLMKAAKLVADATTALVAVAREAWDRKAEDEEALVGLNNAAQRKAEFEQRVEIERLQAALERAQSKQRNMRAAEYTEPTPAPAAGRGGAGAAPSRGGGPAPSGRGAPMAGARGGAAPAPAGRAGPGGAAPARGGVASRFPARN